MARARQAGKDMARLRTPAEFAQVQAEGPIGAAYAEV